VTHVAELEAEGMSRRAVADVLGVGEAQVRRDRATDAAPEPAEPAPQVEPETPPTPDVAPESTPEDVAALAAGVVPLVAEALRPLVAALVADHLAQAQESVQKRAQGPRKRACEVCGASLGDERRRHARYCSATCRSHARRSREAGT
jgi:hypothetical protein